MSEEYSTLPADRSVVPVQEPANTEVELLYKRHDNLADYYELVEMLTYRRPAKSKSERAFIKAFIMPLQPQEDGFGNFWVEVGEGSPIMWSAHTDTVHNHKGRQRLGWSDTEIGIWEKETSNCLGADDTAGCWLMVQMIKNNIPGVYVFHREEECGRNGSEWIAKHCKDVIKDIKFCIALDRKGTNSVITHQRNMRSCSEAFANSLIEQLKLQGLEYETDPTGSFTDSASYTDIISECTNLSVGYSSAHSPYERLNVLFLFQLRDALLKVDYSKLVAEREPGAVERRTYGTSSGYHGYGCYGGEGYYGGSNRGGWGYNGWQDWQDEKDWEADGWKKENGVWVKEHPWGKSVRTPGQKGVTYLPKSASTTTQSDRDFEATDDTLPFAGQAGYEEDEEGTYGEAWMRNRLTMADLVRNNTDAVVDILEQLGFDRTSLKDEIMGTCGVVNY